MHGIYFPFHYRFRINIELLISIFLEWTPREVNISFGKARSTIVHNYVTLVWILAGSEFPNWPSPPHRILYFFHLHFNKTTFYISLFQKYENGIHGFSDDEILAGEMFQDAQKTMHTLPLNDMWKPSYSSQWTWAGLPNPNVNKNNTYQRKR